MYGHFSIGKRIEDRSLWMDMFLKQIATFIITFFSIIFFVIFNFYLSSRCKKLNFDVPITNNYVNASLVFCCVISFSMKDNRKLSSLSFAAKQLKKIWTLHYHTGQINCYIFFRHLCLIMRLFCSSFFLIHLKILL